MKLNPLVIAVGVVGAILVMSKSFRIPNPFNPNQSGTPAPGPASQQAKTNANAGQTGGFSPQTGVSPNSTLATVNNGIVVANNALGFLDKLESYFGNNADSEYPVPNSSGPVATPDVLAVDTSYTGSVSDGYIA